MQIRTIHKSLYKAEQFDDEVNYSIKDGWTLVRREVIVPPTGDKQVTLYAELVKGETQKGLELTWRDALQVIQAECENAAECSATGCEMHAWCQAHLRGDADNPLLWTWSKEV